MTAPTQVTTPLVRLISPVLQILTMINYASDVSGFAGITFDTAWPGTVAVDATAFDALGLTH